MVIISCTFLNENYLNNFQNSNEHITLTFLREKDWRKR
jgi:hypothetical protein